jgi:methylated-DNA-[protein]-cysteine S-methyltransferase
MNYVLSRPTSLGWFAIVGDGEGVRFIAFGHPTEQGLRERLILENVRMVDAPAPGALPTIADAVEAYLEGEPVDLTRLPAHAWTQTPFQRRVVEALRSVGYGETISYADLAARAGSPRAARAVGTVMASNRLPLVIPCHRVIGAGNRLGGFSAPQGLAMKEALLALEQGRRAPLSPLRGPERTSRTPLREFA